MIDLSKLDEVVKYVTETSERISSEISTELSKKVPSPKDQAEGPGVLHENMENLMYLQGNITVEIMEFAKIGWELNKLRYTFEGPSGAVDSVRKSINDHKVEIEKVIYALRTAVTTVRDRIFYYKNLIGIL